MCVQGSRQGAALIAFLVALLASSVVHAEPNARQRQMLFGLQTVHGTFDALYAPKDWKKEHLGWDLDAEIAKAQKRVMAKDDITLLEYRKIVVDFFRSARDYHVDVSFLSTEYSFLPFEVVGVQGRFFLSYVDRKKLPKHTFPFEPGAELVTLDGKRVGPLVDELKRTFGGNTSPTDQRLAERALTMRRADKGMVVPRGRLEVTFKVDGEPASRQISWTYHEETVTLPGPGRGGEPKLEQRTSGDLGLSPIPMHASIASPYTLNSDPHGIGHRDGFLPPLEGRILWKAPEGVPFHAYIVEGAQGVRIGFVRIATYSPLTPNDAAEAFGNLIGRFDDDADVLVIDQTNNGGGLATYMYGLLSMLTDRPLKTPQHRLTLTPDQVMSAQRLVRTLGAVKSSADLTRMPRVRSYGETTYLFGYPIDYQFAQLRLESEKFKLREWAEGRSYTQPTYLGGIDQVNPHPVVRFTKPLIVLTNALDFSCADFFPAILQDNKRALIMGTRTAGAGGYVHSVEFPPNMLGLEGFQLTGSLAERSNTVPIENLGVKPDVDYQLSLEDVQHGYKPYAKAIGALIQSRFAPAIVKARAEARTKASVKAKHTGSSESSGPEDGSE
jgi:hypothetical protein